MLIHGVHALRAACLHHRHDLIGLAFADEVCNSGGRDQNFCRHRPTLAVGTFHEGLADNPLQGRCKLSSDLALLMRRKNVYNTVNCLRCVLSMECGEDKVARFCCSQRNRNGLKVAKFADENHIRVLAKYMLERSSETMSVRTYFTLVDDGLLVVMQKFNWVFDRDDVVG